MRAPERNLTSFEARRFVEAAPAPTEYIYVPQSDLPGVLRKLWRRKTMIISIALGLLLLAAIAGVLMADRYAATAQVRVGVPQPRIAQVENVVAALAPDPETMETEAQAAQSRAIATAVVRRLGLDKDPEFNRALKSETIWQEISRTLWQWVTLDFLRASDAPDTAPDTNASRDRYDADQQVVETLRSRLDVTQEGRSHILDIEVQSENPFKAARIANTVADVYIESRLERRARENQQTGNWLDQQIDKLRARVDKAERQVEDYRRSQGLYQTKSATVTEQQLGELNTQLILAQSEKSGAEAKLADAERLLRSGATGEVPAVLSSPTIIALKQQEAEVARHAAELKATYGPKHPQVVNSQAQAQDIQRKIRGEMGLVVQGLRNEAKTAGSRYAALRASLDQIKGQMGQTGTQSVKLHELEREAEASRSLFQTFLLRFQETQAQQNFIGADGEVVSMAVPPTSASYPPRKLMILLGALCGLALGAFLALLTEQMDRSYRTADEIESDTGLPMLAMVPRLKNLKHLIRRTIGDPNSPYAQALRKLHTSLLFSRTAAPPPKIVLMTSTMPKEGKSNLSVSLAALLAQEGLKVIVLDCDWHRPNVHRLLRTRNRVGLADALQRDIAELSQAEALRDVIHVDARSGAHFLFAGDVRRLGRGAIRFERLQALVSQISQSYDLVVIDGPPVLVGTEALHLSRISDATVFVVHWGHTSHDEVTSALGQLREMRANIAGVVLSQVNPRRYKQYGRGPLTYHYARPAAGA